jgi:hypothetical protein
VGERQAIAGGVIGKVKYTANSGVVE